MITRRRRWEIKAARHCSLLALFLCNHLFISCLCHRELAAPWVPGKVGPSVLPHDGQPELLATREGPILHVASGIHWTNDAGQTWHKLQVPGAAYYPRSIQAADGRIFVFGHVGGDNAYGKVDQSIVMDSFRLKVK